MTQLELAGLEAPCAVCATPTSRVNPPCNPPIWYGGTTRYPLCEKHGGITFTDDQPVYVIVRDPDWQAAADAFVQAGRVAKS